LLPLMLLLLQLRRITDRYYTASTTSPLPTVELPAAVHKTKPQQLAMQHQALQLPVSFYVLLSTAAAAAAAAP
jgi:hypothetical protein